MAEKERRKKKLQGKSKNKKGVVKKEAASKKHEKKHVIKKRKVQSTQQNVPIKDIVKGVIITDNNDYLKIIEVFPAPFFFKKVSEQNKVGQIFAQMFKTAPGFIHIKSIAVPADLSVQRSKLYESMSSETNESCRNIGNEYEKRINYAQNFGITRRFFIIISYEKKGNMYMDNELDDAVYQLNNRAREIASVLKRCGNDVKTYDYSFRRDDAFRNENLANFKLLYLLYNRQSYYSKPFETRYEEVLKRYVEAERKENVYIPPKDLISSQKISYKDKKYIVCDDLYYTYLYIPSNGYNSRVVTGWLDGFVNSANGVDVDIYLERLNKNYIKKELDHILATSSVSMEGANDFSDAYANSAGIMRAGYYIKDGLSNGQDIYNMSIMITVSGSSIREVDQKVEYLTNFARQNDIILRKLIFEEEAAFQSALPLNRLDKGIENKAKRNVLTIGAASTYPFTTFEMIHDNGLYIADDISTGTPVIPDFFNRAVFDNPHVFICGKTGAGKTVSLMTLAVRARVLHIPVFIISPEKSDEFFKLCDEIGGQFIDFGLGSKDRINIMDVHPLSDEVRKKFQEIDGYKGERSYLDKTIGNVLEFLEIHHPGFSMEEKQMLNEAIIETYRRKGITQDNDSLWVDSKKTVLKEMPILSDLVQVLLEDEETKSMGRIVKFLTQGAGAHFDGHTNIDSDNKFIVIAVNNNTGPLLNVAMYTAMTFFWEKIMQDRTEKKFFIMDEWWKMAQNEVAMDRSEAYSRLARALSCSMVFATQQMTDVVGADDRSKGKIVLGSCATKIVLALEENDVRAVKDLIGLTKDEVSMVPQFNPGQALFLAGTNRMRVQFNPTESEKLIMFTDEQTLKKRAENERKKIMNKMTAEQRKELINAAESEDVLFETQSDIEKNINVVNDKIFISTDDFINEFTEDDFV